MPFKKGDSNINTKGRKPNSLNLTTKQSKELLAEFMQSNYSTFLERLNNLNDKDYCGNYILLLKYIMPTLKATEITEPKKNDYNNAEKIEIEIIHSNQNK
jgi:hypothetical protein